MIERPISCTTENVLAILARRQTQTRRVIIPQPPDIAGLYWLGGRWYMPPGEPASLPPAPCRYGKPGDRLWVREAFRVTDRTARDMARVAYKAGGGVRHVHIPETHWDTPTAQPREKWVSGRFMPSWASRIVLGLTEVRAERLQDISEMACYAEGRPLDLEMDPVSRPGASWFRDLWNSVDSTRGRGWDVNPWVWVLTFRWRNARILRLALNIEVTP